MPIAPPLAFAAGLILAVPARGQAASPQPAAATAQMPRVEEHIDDLHSRLAITPAQEPQWAAFAAVLRQNARDLKQAYAEHPVHAPGGSAVDDLRNYAAVVRQHADTVNRLVPPFENLYGVLSPTQRAAADSTFQSFRAKQGQAGRP